MFGIDLVTGLLNSKTSKKPITNISTKEELLDGVDVVRMKDIYKEREGKQKQQRQRKIRLLIFETINILILKLKDQMKPKVNILKILI